jgi:tetratricopeptide (TPR) repeat protein
MPVVRQTNWLLVIPQLVVMAVLIVIVAAVFKPEPLFLSGTYGAGLYLIYSYGSRWLLLKSHRQGMQLTREKNYPAAIQKFDESYQFLSRYPWIDRYRYFTLMSPSAMHYREMALINIAFCYAQLGNIDKTKAYYQRAIAEYPDSEMAKIALNFITSVEQSGAIST